MHCFGTGTVNYGWADIAEIGQSLASLLGTT